MDFQIGKLQAISLIIIVMINKILLNIPKSIISQSKTGSPINTIFTCIISIIIALIITNLFKKNPNEDIIDISYQVGKKPLQILVGISLTFLISIAILTVIYEFTNLLQVIYFPTTPVYFIFMSFIICMATATNKGLKSILKTNCIISILMVLSLFVILIGVIKSFNITRLYPILGKNLNTTFIQGSQNLFSYSGLIYLLFLPPLLKNKKDFNKIAIISMTISGLFLFFIITILLAIFPFITHSEETLSMYLLARCIEFGKYIQRTDALFIMLWIISSFSYLSISLYFISNIFGKITNCRNSSNYSYSFLGIFFGLLVLFQNQSLFHFLETTVYKYTVFYTLILCIIILILANFKRKEFFEK